MTTADGEAARRSKNTALLQGSFLPFLLGCLVLLAVSVGYVWKFDRQGAREHAFMAGLGLVALSFGTEIVIFLHLIRPWCLLNTNALVVPFLGVVTPHHFSQKGQAPLTAGRASTTIRAIESRSVQAGGSGVQGNISCATRPISYRHFLGCPASFHNR